MSEKTLHHEGGCFCGSVRYRLTGPPDWSAHCHCRSCQRAVGAAFTTWVGAKSKNFKVTKGHITICAWPGVKRGFCSQCGTSLTYVAEDGWPGQVGILAPTLDDPDIASPTAHANVEDQLCWVKIGDDLPRYEQNQ